MRVAKFTALKQIEIVEESEPSIERPDDVLVRIDRVGVCGSDVHYYLDGRIGNQEVRYPADLGHECAGTIEKTGENVVALCPGDRVAIDPAFVCGVCDQCMAGRANTCRRLQFMGCPGEAPGAVAEYRVLPARNCFRIPDSMTLDEATIVEPLTIGYHTLRLGGLQPGAKAAVFGAGPIGLSTLLLARPWAGGPVTIYVTDVLDERLAVARRCGADWTGNPRRDDVVATILREEPRGIDVVFECSGDPACVDQAMHLLAPGGTLVLVGIPSAETISFDPHVMRRKELTFKNVRRQNDCTAAVLKCMAQDGFDPSPLLTHRFPLAQIHEAFELVAGYRDGVIKAVIDISGAD